MSREAYTAPTSTSQINDPHSQSQTQTSSSAAAGWSSQAVDRGTDYRCGDCNAKVTVKRGDAVRCKDCGYRVLYKERTNRIVQFEAR